MARLGVGSAATGGAVTAGVKVGARRAGALAAAGGVGFAATGGAVGSVTAGVEVGVRRAGTTLAAAGGVGLLAAGGAGGGVTAGGAVGARRAGAFFGDGRRGSAFFVGFFLAAAIFLRLAGLATGPFLRFALGLPLAFFLMAIDGLPRRRTTIQST